MRYYISYVYTKNGAQRWGASDVIARGGIKDFQTVCRLIERLEKENEFDTGSCIIVAWQRYD